MKVRTIYIFPQVLLFNVLIASTLMAQQLKKDVPYNIFSEKKVKPNENGEYTYRVFAAPNKIFGYDLFYKGHIIFHQPALAQPAGNKLRALLEKAQADKAATMAIEKIKKGLPAELTQNELRQITGQ